MTGSDAAVTGSGEVGDDGPGGGEHAAASTTAVFGLGAQLRYALFAAVLAVALALPGFAARPRAGWWVAAGVVAAAMVAGAWRAERRPDRRWLGLAAALLGFPLVLLLEASARGDALTYIGLFAIPVLWSALYLGGRLLGLTLVVTVAALFVPIAVIGEPTYPDSAWRDALLWAVVLAFVAPAVKNLVTTTRRNADRALAGELRYRRAFADAPVPMAIVGAQGAERGTILQANRPLHALLGVDDDLVGRQVGDFVHPEDADALIADSRHGQPDGTRMVELRVVQPSGRVRWVCTSFALVRLGPGEPRRFICHLEDITVRHESEQTLLDSLEQQSDAASRLRESALTRDDFVAAVSHDVRSPLATISAYVELLGMGEAGELNDDQRAMLDVIAQNVRRANGLTEDLLTLDAVEHSSPIESGEPVDIDEVLAGVVRAIGPSARARDQRLTLDSTLAGALVAGRAAQLDRVLANLLTNAVKFTPEGGHIEVRGRRGTNGGREQVVIEVSDSGPGIPLADQEHVFERFYRSESARRRRVAGTGLGLAIVREIATLHGGEVGVRSQPGHGATFTVTLPTIAERPERRERPAASEDGERLSRPGSAARR